VWPRRPPRDHERLSAGQRAIVLRRAADRRAIATRKDDLRVADASLEDLELARLGFELRFLQQALGFAQALSDLAAHVGELAFDTRTCVGAAAEARKRCQRAQDIGEALVTPIAGAHRPEEVLEDAEYHEAERDSNEAIARDRQ
jgi:hypothetical protein